MLRIEELSVKYSNSKNLALNSINFSAKIGEFIVIAGPSGSGKSTLAKSILGLIPAFEEAHIDGQIICENNNLSEFTREERIKLLKEMR